MKDIVDYNRLQLALSYAPAQPHRRNGATFSTLYLITQMLKADKYSKWRGTIYVPFFVNQSCLLIHGRELIRLIGTMDKALYTTYTVNPLRINVWKKRSRLKRFIHWLFKVKIKPTHCIMVFSEEFGPKRILKEKPWTYPFMDHYFYESQRSDTVAQVVYKFGHIIWDFDDLAKYYEERKKLK